MLAAQQQNTEPLTWTTGSPADYGDPYCLPLLSPAAQTLHLGFLGERATWVVAIPAQRLRDQVTEGGQK